MKNLDVLRATYVPESPFGVRRRIEVDMTLIRMRPGGGRFEFQARSGLGLNEDPIELSVASARALHEALGTLLNDEWVLRQMGGGRP